MTRDEVALALGLSVAQVRKAETDALGKLLQGLKDAGADPEDRHLLEAVLADLFDGQDPL